MALFRRAGGLLKTLGGLARQCCCRWWCVPDPSAPPDTCGNPATKCIQSGRRPSDAVAGPFSSEEECDCPPEEECCEVDADCPEGYCCVEGECAPCDDPPPPEDEWNCCYEDSTTGSESSGVGPPPRCVQGPCLDRNGIPAPMLRASGPHASRQKCADSCRPHDCASSPCCGGPDCFPADAGPYETLQECLERCPTPPAGVCAVQGLLAPNCIEETGGSTAGEPNGVAVFTYSINCDPGPDSVGRSSQTKVCLRYVSLNCKPIRVRILHKQLDMDGSCNVIADPVAAADSRWVCKEDCACEELEAFPGASCNGKCAGTLRWRTKQRGVVEFKVEVRAPCPDSSWAFKVGCECCDPCDGKPAPCPPEDCDPPCACECSTACGQATIEINGHTIEAILYEDYLACNNTPSACDGGPRDCAEYLTYFAEAGRWYFAKHLYSYREWTTTIGGVEYTFTEPCAPGNTSTYGYFDCRSGGGEVFFQKYDSTEDWPFYEGGMEFSGTVGDSGVCEDGDLVFRNFTETYCNDQAGDPIADCDPEVVIRFSGCSCPPPNPLP